MKRMSLGVVLLLGIGLTVPLAACGDGDEAGPAETPAATPAETPAATPATPVEGGPPEVSGEPTTTTSGLQFIDIEVGTGDAPQPGQTVEVHYTGWLTDGTKFDSSLDRGQPFSFVIGTGRVIAGWDEGVASMKVGGERRLIIPAELAYGEQGYPGVIPANAQIIFDVELLAIK